MQTGSTNKPIEIALTSARTCTDAFNEIDADAVFTSQSGAMRKK